jgi:hypothetical protein
MHINNHSKSLFRLFNQVFELERKIDQLADSESVTRQVRRMRDLFEQDFQLTYEDPLGQPFNETRTDVEARVAGDSADNLVIIETLKPVIRYWHNPRQSEIVQKGIVVAGRQSEQSEQSKINTPTPSNE